MSFVRLNPTYNVCQCTTFLKTSLYSHPACAGTKAVAVDGKRTSLMEFGRYVQEMMPKFVQHAQITHG